MIMAPSPIISVSSILTVHFILQNELFVLVTDQGFLNEKNVVWETLNNVEGDGYFVDAQFHTYTKPPPISESLAPPPVPPGSEEQVDQDYLLAMSLQQEQQMTDEELAWKHSQQPQEHAQISDHELAARLQAEEDERAMRAMNEQQQRQQQQQPQGQRSAAAAPGASRGRPRERAERDREPRDKSKDNRRLTVCNMSLFLLSVLYFMMRSLDVAFEVFMASIRMSLLFRL
uniref:Ubiquitin carboxyl-terminal hydrolase n=1 Tax=Magallana gigas TaxID=29159 RepID=A0A8W8MT13_MAGGI